MELNALKLVLFLALGQCWHDVQGRIRVKGGKLEEMYKVVMATARYNGTKSSIRRERNLAPPYFLKTIDCECGRTYEGTRIVGGQEVDPLNRYPWLALLFITYSDGGVFVCTASLISDRNVLSAAHCLVDRPGVGPPTSVAISLGEHNWQDPSDTDVVIVLAINILNHPLYAELTSGPAVYDIAVLTTAVPIEFTPKISPICLPRIFDSYADDDAVATGWGRTNYLNPGIPDVPHEVTLRVLSQRECHRYTLFLPIIPRNQVCAYNPGQGICGGDSGGPLAVKNSLGQYEIVGIASYGPTQCAANYLPSFYTRVTSYLDWIRQHTKQGKFCSGSPNPLSFFG